MIDPRFADAWERLPDYLGNHVLVSLSAMAIGLGVSLPLAIFARRRKRVRATLLGLASVVQTIPGLALLTLFYPLLLALAALSQSVIGRGFSALGFLPAVLALALYSMLPVLRNTVAGLGAVAAGPDDAATALGMTRSQVLWLVDVPIAMPVIMAGIRTAAVWVIGTATLSTPIGQASLGNYIFTGLQTQNWVFVLFGCIAAAALALFVDQMLALIERGIAAHSRLHVGGGTAGIALLIAAALIPIHGRSQSTYVIGAKPFAEQYVLAALFEQRLNAAGLSASRRAGLGSSVIFNALAAGEIDAYVEYTGTIWANQMHRSDAKSREDVLAEVGVWLDKTHRIKLLGPLGFENAYALAMTKKHADTLGIASLADLAIAASRLSIAGDYEFFGRPEWAALRVAYGLNFANQRQMQAEFMYPAVANGEVDVISAYSSDGQIAKYDLRVLGDPKQAIPPYDAILLLSPKRANDTALIDALKPLIGAIPVETMRTANLRAASGGANGSPEVVARWLATAIKR
ncbi:MAG: ABC transporter permease/substrate-binding protein [Pseudolabrys sp.]|nr:ABC transporter permease/substrate-binding protein [Pseudolabrys sp.]